MSTSIQNVFRTFTSRFWLFHAFIRKRTFPPAKIYIYMSTSHYPDLSIIEVPRREKLSEALRSLTTLYKPSRRIAIDHPSIVSYSLSYGGVQSTYLQPIPDFTESPCNVETGKHRCISRCIFLWFEREFRNSSENRLRWKANPHSWPFVRSIGFVPHPMK